MEVVASSDQYRSSSSSASSPARRYYLPKPGALRRPISFEDSPDWDDIHPDDTIHLATAASASISIASSAYPSPSPSLPQGSSSASAACRDRKVAGVTLVWKDLTVSSLAAATNRFSDRLVKSSNGYALPATLTVIMGPARSGKSTLLRAIAGLLSVCLSHKSVLFYSILYPKHELSFSFMLLLKGVFECTRANS
jgi:ABC-type multidrug transport system fused ATPase/permease subunit